MYNVLALKALKVAHKQLIDKYLGHVTILQRLDRALAILVTDTEYGYRLGETGVLTVVKRDAHNERTRYEVDAREKRCNCPDSENGNICKHRLAHELLLLSQEIVTRAEGDS